GIDALRSGGTTILRGSTVLAAPGSRRGGRVVVGGPVRAGSDLSCGPVCVAPGGEPAAAPLGHAGVKLRMNDDGCLVPGQLPAGLLVAGEVAGVTGLDTILASGRLAGSRAADAAVPHDLRPSAGFAGATDPGGGQGGTRREARDGRRKGAEAPLRGKKFICLCEDVTDKDVRQAIAEGFDHIETLKRYTTVTMGPCQGKMCHRLSIDLCAAETGRTVEETGTTTSRPPAQPVPLGALAACIHEPIKRTPMHHLHEAAGARMMDMGAWRRPLVYTTVDEECRAVREAVGLIDVGTLGKLDLKGRDAAAFLDWLHPNRFSDMAPGRARYRL